MTASLFSTVGAILAWFVLGEIASKLLFGDDTPDEDEEKEE